MNDKPVSKGDFELLCIEAYQVYMSTNPRNKSEAAKILGIARKTLSNRINKYHLRDLGKTITGGVDEGREVKEHTKQFDGKGNLRGESIKTTVATADEGFQIPDGHRVKGISAFLDADGNKRGEWVKTVEGERSDEVIFEAARLAAEKYAGPAAPISISSFSKDHIDEKLMNLHLLPDLHIGLHSSSMNAQMDWSLQKALDTYSNLFRLIIERSPNAKKGVVLGGGDLLHADDPIRATRGSGNRLDVAEPYEMVLSGTENLMVYQVELALMKYEEVEVRILKGNHDPDSAVAIAHYLAAWFRNEPRVKVDLDPSLFWFYEHGVCMLGATHGHETKINKLPGIMASDRHEMWGRTKVRYGHGFHIHHNTGGNGEEGGASWETHEAPTPRDDWHQGNPFRSRRSLPLITYHQDHGETGRTLETLI